MKEKKSDKNTKGIWAFLKGGDARIIVFTPIALASLAFVNAIVFQIEGSGDFSLLWLCFWLSMTGVAMIIRQEIPRPGYPSIKGTAAVILGSLWVLFAGSGLIIIFIERIIGYR